MADDAKLLIYDIAGTRLGEANLVEGEVVFPDPAMRWVWVLDARHAPYTELPLEDVLHRAAHVNKRYVLVGERSD